MGKILFLQLIIVLAVGLNYCLSFAFPKPIEPYMSGEEKLKAAQADEHHEYAHRLRGEIGKIVRVPLDYKNPSEGTIGIYYFTKKEFKPENPTMIYFQGGPGGGPHEIPVFHQLENWNVVFMENRGMAMSYPDKVETYYMTKYFTSENVARDAAEVAKALGVEKISAYGSSYGTLTATIFASLFPDLVRSVILEGIIYKGDEYLWSSSHRQKILQKYFDALPVELQDRIIKISGLDGVYPAWFSRMAQSMMYGDEFSQMLGFMLGGLMEGTDEDAASEFKDNPDAMFNMDDMFEFSPSYFLHIACKELSGFADHATFSFVFENRKLVPMKQTVIKQACTEMNIDPTLIKQYDATNYRIKVPTFYVQGTLDGATTAPGGIWHYKNVPEGKAQLFLIKGGGHGPLINNFDDDDFLALVEKMLLGEQTSKEYFKENFQKKYPNWVTTLK